MTKYLIPLFLILSACCSEKLKPGHCYGNSQFSGVYAKITSIREDGTHATIYDRSYRGTDILIEYEPGNYSDEISCSIVDDLDRAYRNQTDIYDLQGRVNNLEYEVKRLKEGKKK